MPIVRSHRLVALVVAALTLGGLSACGSGGSSSSTSAGTSGSTADKSPITIGFVVGRTGVLESYDLPAETMAKFAIDDINKAGGIDGRQIKTVEADMKSKPELAGNAATEVISQGADVLVLPCDFDLGAPAAVVAQDAGKIGMSLCAASTNFGPAGIGDLAYTMGLAGVTEGTAAAEWAYTKQKYRSTYVLYDTTLDQNKQAVDAFTKTWDRVGGKLVGEDTFKQTDQSVAAQVSRIAELSPQPDFLYVSSYQPGFAKTIKQIRAAGVNTPIIGGSDLDGDYWKGAVPGLSNTYFTAMASIYGDDPEAKVNKLIDRYKASEGSPPDVSAFLAGYAVIQALQKAIEEAGSTDGKAMTEKMQQFTDEPFVLQTTFTPTEHISLHRTVRIMKIDNGKTSFVTLFTPTDIPTPSD
jgi:branched-chain amino acid transport system substrate-binding protein